MTQITMKQMFQNTLIQLLTDFIYYSRNIKHNYE